jgi:ribosomal protein L29
VLKRSVAFEKKIRNRWGEKNASIAELEARIAELEKELETLRVDSEEDVTPERGMKERKLLALMVNDLGIADTEMSVP